MKSIKNNLLNNRFFMWIVLPIFLTLIWISLTAFYIIHLDTAFSVISYNEPTSSFTNATYSKLFKGDSIGGSFTAHDNNLGIVAVKFQTFFRPAFADEDKILFQIREKGAKTWYYENTYRDGFIYNIPFFPFGFPLIQKSKGKRYEFRITSLDGNNTNSVALSRGSQILATKYKYTKEILLHNRKTLIHFVITKISTAFRSFSVVFSSFIYILPLLFYIVFLISQRIVNKKYEYMGKKKSYSYLFPQGIPKNRVVLLFLTCVLLLCAIVDMFFLQVDNDAIYILIPLLWILVHKIYGTTSRLSFIIGIGFLFIPPIFLSFNLTATAEQVAIYAFLFLTASVILLFPLQDINKSE